MPPRAGISDHAEPPSACDGAGRRSSLWRERYAEKHRLRRVASLPAGIDPPRRVRMYQRGDHFWLQWWDPHEKKTLSQRVDGDLIDAIAVARLIEERLNQLRFSGHHPGKYNHAELVQKYSADLERRADAGEIDFRTVQRYRAAMQHYLAFAEQPAVAKAYPQVARVDRDFQLRFAAFLSSRMVLPNGRTNSHPRPMKAQKFVMDVVRGMFAWAADPARGNLLPGAFRNPFVGCFRRTETLAGDPITEPDVTGTMAVELLLACDLFQLGIFAPLLLYGLRPGELGWIFWENVEEGWLKVACNQDLGYATKGRRDKRFPVLACLEGLWRQSNPWGQGLLYRCRGASADKTPTALSGASLGALIDEFNRRCRVSPPSGAAQRRGIRDAVMKNAGQLSYDRIKREFDQLARRLGWPAEATLKDLRHLFATSLENSGTPDFFKRYLLGQAFGKAPIVAYTHVTAAKLREHYQRAVATELAPLVDAVARRADELGTLPKSTS
ncbi:MAG: hypothetical protein KY475_08330 [Planctomycetes bacterium]|nr:hypothetical protein [Planctomycetota bacterium]